MAERRVRGDRAAVELRGVARRFGARWALRGIDLRVEPGSVVALRGHNGSGKTTLLRVCATVLRPSRGTVSVFGRDTIDDADGVRGLVGFLTHRAGLYEDLTAAENLRFAARMLGEDSGGTEIAARLERVGLGGVAAERVRGFSSGMQRRLAFARVMLRPPRLLLLDEPYASFDAEAVELVNGFAREVAGNGGAVLIATHDTSRAGGVAEREVWLEAGQVVTSRESRVTSDAPRTGIGEAREVEPEVRLSTPEFGASSHESGVGGARRATRDSRLDGSVEPGTANHYGARRVAP